MDLDAYRARAQAFATELNRAHFERFAGLTAAWDPAAIHARHAELWDADTIEELRNAGPPAPRRLLRFAVEARLGAATARLEVERARAEADEGVAALAAALAVEDDADRRAALEEERLDATARRLTAPAAAALERVRSEARALGWPSARAMWGELHAIDLGALAAHAERLLREPPPALPGWARARHDLPRLRRREPDPGAVGRLRAVLATLALEPRFIL
ncbi:MAG TPA: hypothetical protein VLA98_15265, partial [Solirubrobacteraceae bacterium]|nr:hypothetical protein [Solirubrobacteraceae bacterium]